MARTLRYFPDYRNYQTIGGFYHESENSLDAVYLGSSNCYTFWNAPAAWNRYGLTVYPYASASQPFCATEYLIRETRKTQPDALFIVNVNGVEADDLDATSIHYLVSFMPDSELKSELTEYLADLLDYSEIDKLEFKFPWLRNRELWLHRLLNGPLPTLNGLKGAPTYERHLDSSMAMDISDRHIYESRAGIPQALTNAVTGLLDYCSREGIRVLFVVVPRKEDSETTQGRINTVCDMIRGRGYPVLDMAGLEDEIGLDLTQDYYNGFHTNIHGSIKFTGYLCRYLISHYGMKDKRGRDGYESWDTAWERYSGIAAPWTLDIEWDTAHRDHTLIKPESITAAKDGSVWWDAVTGAEGYAIYRKTGEAGAWERLGDVEGTDYEDTMPPEGARYTVVPWRERNGEICYGDFDYAGVEPR
ncbi:MAG: hypothetical protein IJJ45_00575 [Clostridia bacterium]|nr:hypothetical protein [Clostridia bacterium]